MKNFVLQRIVAAPFLPMLPDQLIDWASLHAGLIRADQRIAAAS